MPRISMTGQTYALYLIYHMGTLAGFTVSLLEDAPFSTLKVWDKEFFGSLGFESFKEFVAMCPGNCWTDSKMMEADEHYVKKLSVLGGDNDKIDNAWVLFHKDMSDPLFAPDYVIEQVNKGCADTLLVFPKIKDVRLVEEYKEEQADGVVIPDEELWFCLDWKE